MIEWERNKGRGPWEEVQDCVRTLCCACVLWNSVGARVCGGGNESHEIIMGMGGGDS